MTGLVIEAVSAESAIGWHAVDAAAHETDHVGLPADPVEELLPLLAGEVAGERVELWLGVAAGDPVVAGAVRMPVHDNLAAATVDVQVHPDQRRRGHGQAMFTHLLARARSHGRHRIFGEVAEPLDDGAASATAGRAFAVAAGARPVLTEVRRMLDLDQVDSARLARLRAEAATYAAGYTLVQWVDRTPPAIHDDLGVLLGRMVTHAPLEEMDWEPEDWTGAPRGGDQHARTWPAAGRDRGAA